MTAEVSVSENAATHRRDSARLLTLILAGLGWVVILPAHWLGARLPVVVVLIATATTTAIAHWMVRRSAATAGILLTLASIYAQHITLAVCNPRLEPTPYLASIPILVAAATLPSRQLWWILSTTVLTLGIEGAVRPLDHMDQIALLAGAVLTIVTFVVSILDSRNTERAFAIIAERDRERAAFVAKAESEREERHQFELRLLASDRLETLGRLAGSVAHDFNNLLMVIGGAAEMARLAVKDNPEATEDVDSILDATRGASRLTQQLLAFSRRQVVSATRLDLAASLENSRELLERLLGKKISLAFDLEPNCPMVMMAAAHFEQLATNLAINARDAMPDGGRLTFALKTRHITAEETATQLVAGTYLELTATDQGCGVPSELREQIFEPMFTTKGTAGTGLGLATCRSIATECHGTIACESAPEKGSVFRVLLPAESTSERISVARPSPTPEAIHRILIVDDEPAPRETTARLLRASKFDVVVASNLQDARRIIGDRSLKLDALLTDVILSGELGTDLLEDCRQRRPNTRIVVMSGYSPDRSMNEKLRRMHARFLPKPFNRNDLLRALQGERE